MWDALELVFGLARQNEASHRWREVLPFISPDAEAMIFTLYGEEVRGADMTQSLVDSGKEHFVVVGGGYEISFSPLEHFQLSFMRVRSSRPKSIDDWQSWVSGLIDEQFINARLFDFETEYWDNAEDPIEFEAAGRSFDHLTLRSNGLPAPLEKQVVDVSRNARRRVLRQGYIEAIGEVMWVSPAFVKRTNCCLDVVESADYVREFIRSNGVIRVWCKLVDSIAERIRRDLFPNAVSPII